MPGNFKIKAKAKMYSLTYMVFFSICFKIPFFFHFSFYASKNVALLHFLDQFIHLGVVRMELEPIWAMYVLSN